MTRPRSDETKQTGTKGRYGVGKTTTRHAGAAPSGDTTVRKTYSRKELIESIRSKAQTLPDGPI